MSDKHHEAAKKLREMLDNWEVGGAPRETIIGVWELLTGDSYVEVQLVEAALDPHFGKSNVLFVASPACTACEGYRVGQVVEFDSKGAASVSLKCYECGYAWQVS